MFIFDTVRNYALIALLINLSLFRQPKWQRAAVSNDCLASHYYGYLYV
jgi:hypothetical protein